jgi:hypothetical protein
MKKQLCAVLSLAMFSAVSLADDAVVITSKPALLKKDGNVYVYTVPTDYSTTTSYHYVSVDGENRVCYADAQPSFTTVQATPLEVRVEDKTTTWQCYPATASYFKISE